MENQACGIPFWGSASDESSGHTTSPATPSTALQRTSSPSRTPSSGLRAAAGLRDRTAFYSRDKLIYDAERDQCGVPRASRCRGTAPSTPKRWSSTASRPSLTTPARSRQPAPTRNAAGIIQRSVYAAYLEKVHGHHATEAYKRAMRKSRDDRLRKSASESMSRCRERAVCAHIQVSGESHHVRQFAPRSSEQELMPLSCLWQERG